MSSERRLRIPGAAKKSHIFAKIMVRGARAIFDEICLERYRNGHRFVAHFDRSERFRHFGWVKICDCILQSIDFVVKIDYLTLKTNTQKNYISGVILTQGWIFVTLIASGLKR